MRRIPARLGGSFLSHGRRVHALRHVAHDDPDCVTGLGQRYGVAIPKRNATFLPMPIVLREIGLAAARSDAHAEPALFVIENEHVAFALRAFQAIDAIERELHGFPAGPLRISGPQADPIKRHFGARYVASCQEGRTEVLINQDTMSGPQ